MKNKKDQTMAFLNFNMKYSLTRSFPQRNGLNRSRKWHVILHEQIYQNLTFWNDHLNVKPQTGLYTNYNRNQIEQFVYIYKQRALLTSALFFQILLLLTYAKYILEPFLRSAFVILYASYGAKCVLSYVCLKQTSLKK